MRASDLFERAASRYYIHTTKIEYINSILKKGLVPNASNGGQGNYDDFDWISLEGVYATREPGLIERYLAHHGLQDEFALCVLAVSPNSTLPDEDTINLIMRKAFEDVLDRYDIDDSYESLDEYFAHRYDVEEPHPDDIRDLDQLWRLVGEEFHKRASSPSDPRPADPKMLEELCYGWASLQYPDDGYDVHPEDWKYIKDVITRRYPKMAHPSLGAGWSIRLPHAVGFSGRNRIVAVIAVRDYIGEIVYGQLPAEAKTMLGSIGIKID